MNLETLKKLVAIDSPSGFTEKAAVYVFDLLHEYGWKPEFTNKGAVKCKLGQPPALALAAHLDTLGGMVSGINANGTLRMAKVGSPSLHAYEGSYCRVHTLHHKIYDATLLVDNPAMHVNKELSNKERTVYTMHLRLDEVVKSADDVKNLGIQIGDFVCFEPHFIHYESGFIKSKFMDNKAGCFVLFEIARQMAIAGKTAPVELFFSNYEEVGHGGASGYSYTVEELLVIDMSVVGDGCNGSELTCSICALDSTGPYDYDFRRRLVQLAAQNAIPYTQDIYPFYGSDGSAALRAGGNYRVALIGPGVSASHGIERTHTQGIQATIDLCMSYIDTLS